MTDIIASDFPDLQDDSLSETLIDPSFQHELETIQRAIAEYPRALLGYEIEVDYIVHLLHGAPRAYDLFLTTYPSAKLPSRPGSPHIPNRSHTIFGAEDLPYLRKLREQYAPGHSPLSFDIEQTRRFLYAAIAPIRQKLQPLLADCRGAFSVLESTFLKK